MYPYFSIVIPTLNEADYLPGLLKCLQLQQYQAFEVIVVDAESKDLTIKNAKDFMRQNFPLEILQVKKKNVGFQRNIGAKEAKGNYIVFFDADVRIPPTYLSELKQRLERESFLLATTFIETEEKSLFKKILVLSTNIGLKTFKLCQIPTAGGYNIVIDRTVFKRMGGFDEHIVYGEDFDLIRRYQSHKIPLSILSSPKIFFSFRRFEKLGYLRGVWELVVGTAHAILFGSIKKPLFDYPMGGEVYKKKEIRDK